MIGPSDADRYGWAGVPEGELAGAAAPIARHLARAAVRTVGFLPASGAMKKGEVLAPLLATVGDALLGFIKGSVALVDGWQTWPWGEAMQPGDTATHRQRQIRPRLLEIAPLPCGDAAAATVALGAALRANRPGVEIVLVNLAGYSRPGVIPSAVELVEGVVLLVASRRTLAAQAAQMTRLLPREKNLGAILVG